MITHRGYRRIDLAAAVLLMVSIGSPLFGSDTDRSISLSQALHTALAENPSLRAAELRELSSGYRISEARSGMLPQISASGGYSRYEEPVILAPAKTPPVLDDQIYEASLLVTLPLISGRAWSGVERARAGATEAAAVRALTRLSVMTQVAGIFIAAGELEDNGKLLASRIEALEQRNRELELLLSEGRVSPAETALLEASLEAARSDRIELENRKKELAFHLGRLLGTEAPLFPEPMVLRGEIPSDSSVSASIPEAGPGVIQSKARLRQAESEKDAAVRGLWPELTGFAAYNLKSGGEPDFSGSWAAGLSLRIPLFDAARRLSAIRAADATVQAAEQAYREARISENALSGIFRERQSGLARRRTLMAEAVKKKTIAVEASTERYKEGRTSLSELLTQETELFGLKIQERSLLYQAISTHIDYHTLRGTLSPKLIESMIEEN